jgi:sugar phosphate isomerase/epimerase
VKNNVKLGVRLFSFRNIYPLEEAFQKIRDMGCDAFDITASQTVPGYPWPTDEYVKYFVDSYNKLGLKFISYDGNIDIGIRSDRQLNDDEMFSYALNDVMYANKFGAKIHRVQWHLKPAMLEKLAPYCELFGIKAGIEIHSPLRPSSPVVQEYIEMLKRVQSPWIGLIPDFGAFADRYSKVAVESALKKGTSQDKMNYLIDAIYAGVPLPKAKQTFIKMGADEKDLRVLSSMYHRGFSKPDFDGLKTIMPYSIHFHGKFYQFDEDGYDANIPVRELLTIIKESGFDGYITSEYEGHMDQSDADPAEMVDKQLKLYRSILY